MASCSGDMEQRSKQPEPISLTCTEVSTVAAATRADINEHSSINGESVNIYMPDNTLAGPIVYMVAATPTDGTPVAMTPSSTVYLYPDHTPIYGFYPTAATMSGTQISYSVSEDQSGAANYNLSDLLFAKNDIYKENITTPVNMEFHHLMAKIIVNVSAEVETGIDVVGIRIANVGKTLEFTPSTYTISHDALTGLTATDDVGDGGILAGTSSGCAALIPPQTVSGTKFLIIEGQGSGEKSHNSGSIAYVIPDENPMTFLPGKTYTLTLKLDRWEFGQTMNIAVSDWGSTENIADPRLSI